MGQEKKQIRVTNSKLTTLTTKTRMWSSVTFALLVTGLVTGAIALYVFWLLHHPQQSSSPTIPKIPAMTGVAALGRLTPQGEVIHLSAPTSLEAVQVARLSVKEGDLVRAGQIVAILDGRDRLLAALERAQKQVKVFEARLERVKAGAKTGEIEAQQQAIARLQAELDRAEVEYRRYQMLYQNGAISASILDNKRLLVDTLRLQLQQAKATSNGIAEVRPVDIQVAQAELEDARSQVTQARANLELAYVRAPLDGKVIAIRTHPGEALSKQGIVDLGQTDRMIVVAEVNQNHISKIKLGQKATIISDVFPGELKGIVTQIGSQIGKQSILDTDPAASVDARVVEVQIGLDSATSQKVAKLTNLQVDVIIHLKK
jgi:HlyD family secretion protein